AGIAARVEGLTEEALGVIARRIRGDVGAAGVHLAVEPRTAGFVQNRRKLWDVEGGTARGLFADARVTTGLAHEVRRVDVHAGLQLQRVGIDEPLDRADVVPAVDVHLAVGRDEDAGGDRSGTQLHLLRPAADLRRVPLH